MKRDLTFKKEILFESLRNILANVSILIHKGCTNCERLKEYTVYYTSICLKSYYKYCSLNKEYSKKEFALKKFSLIYAETFREAIEYPEDLKKYLDPLLYSNATEDEQFIILTIFNLPKFFNSNNPNTLKHIINTYIPKIKKCLKNSENYLSYFDLEKNTKLTIKSLLFKFLVENG
jgi:hypothetical protein